MVTQILRFGREFLVQPWLLYQHLIHHIFHFWCCLLCKALHCTILIEVHATNINSDQLNTQILVLKNAFTIGTHA